MVSLYNSSGCPGTQFVYQAGHKFTEFCLLLLPLQPGWLYLVPDKLANFMSLSFLTCKAEMDYLMYGLALAWVTDLILN